MSFLFSEYKNELVSLDQSKLEEMKEGVEIVDKPKIVTPH